MDELKESARQCLVSQGIILGGLSITVSMGLLIIGLLVTTKNSDILHFIALYQLALLEIACGMSSLMIVLYVWWITAGYRNRQLIVRSKYLDEKMSKGLVAMILPILLTFAALIVSSIFLMIKTESTSSYDIKSAMLSYSSDFTRKVIIDKLQITLKCCGSQEIEDWFSINWQNSETVHQCGNVTRRTAWDSVPFSCCCVEAPPPCIHNELKLFGTESIYSTGCAEKLDDAVFTFVLLAVIMFFISTFLMAVLMYSCRKLQTSARSAICKGDATAPGGWWLLTPSQTVREKSTTDSLPLLVRTSGNSETLKCENKYADCKNKIKNIVTTPALFVQKITPYKSYDEESSDEWAERGCEELDSTSNSSFTRTEGNNTLSVSDTAVAHVDISHYCEHKPHPLIRS